MAQTPYQKDRPRLSAELRRSVLVEAGHCCAVRNCGDHTYLEIHHIDQNRENNVLDNLILLCRKHHAMAHADAIDRPSLRLYKAQHRDAELAELSKRLDSLEARISAEHQDMPKLAVSEEQPAPDVAVKSALRRFEVLQFALAHVAISKLEKDLGLTFERNVTFTAGERSIVLDGLRSRGEDVDVVVDVYYLRKSYLDAPAYASFVNEKVELYQLLTGRAATGILLVVVGREPMLAPDALPQTRAGLNGFEAVALHVYSCAQVGFHPGPISAGIL